MTEQYYLGLDLGQSQDYTALCILEQVQQSEETQPNYRIRYLERPQLGTPYPAVVENVSKIFNSEKLKDKSTLVIDQTGCGRPVYDLFDLAGLNPIGISIHGGDAVTHEGNSWRVPKRDLVACLQVLLQNGRLKVSKKLKLEPVLSREMLNFKVKIDPKTAHDSYSSWREGDHDDLVLAVALASWYAEHGPKPFDLSFTAAPVVSAGGGYMGPY
jgi:hypothetical protein